MLQLDRGVTQIVYPSWAEFSYHWKDLDRLLSSPLESGYLNPSYNWQELGYPGVPQTFQLIDGLGGGGIIKSKADPSEKSFAGAILSKEANIRHPSGEMSDIVGHGLNVYYLEPRDGPLHNISFAPPELRKKAKLYTCGTSVENLDAAQDSVYWIVGFKRSKQPSQFLDQLPIWAQHFGVESTPLPTTPDALAEESSSWFVDPSIEYRWFSICGGGESVGDHFAIVVYLGYHLRWVVGKHIVCMHLVSSIDRRPNSRVHWYRK